MATAIGILLPAVPFVVVGGVVATFTYVLGTPTVRKRRKSCGEPATVALTASRWRNPHRCLRGIRRSCRLLAEARDFFDDRGCIEDLRQAPESCFQVRSCARQPGAQ